MGKNLRISSHISKPFLIYNFAPDPIWISLYMWKILFSVLSVHCTIYSIFLWVCSVPCLESCKVIQPRYFSEILTFTEGSTDNMGEKKVVNASTLHIPYIYIFYIYSTLYIFLRIILLFSIYSIGVTSYRKRKLTYARSLLIVTYHIAAAQRWVSQGCPTAQPKIEPKTYLVAGRRSNNLYNPYIYCTVLKDICNICLRTYVQKIAC